MTPWKEGPYNPLEERQKRLMFQSLLASKQVSFALTYGWQEYASSSARISCSYAFAAHPELREAAMIGWTEGPFATLEDCAVRAGEIYREHPAATVYVNVLRGYELQPRKTKPALMLSFNREYNLRVLPDGEDE